MAKLKPKFPDLPDLPGIPDLGDLWGQVQDLVDQSIGAVFSGAVDYIWGPLRPYLQDVFAATVKAGRLAAAAGKLARTMSGRLIHFFEHGAEFVAAWLVHGFLHWIDAIVDLVEDYVDKHWEDPV